MFNPYVKAILAAVIALVASLSAAVEDGHVTHAESVVGVVAAITALSVVWAVGHPMIKWIMGAVIAGAAAFATAVLDDKVTYAEWITIAGAALAALSIAVTTNTTNASPTSKTPV